jgi:hypothetical protein
MVIDIKNIFASINGYKTNIGRGGSQKAHILSPMDIIFLYDGCDLNTFNG